MAETLYRKYRPLSFADVVDQRHVRITLQQAIQQDRLAHAYLFAGPRGVGKTTVARVLARAINCLKRREDGEPCNECEACRSILLNRALDVMEIDAASQTGVDNVRDNIIQSARSVPTALKYKVFIIDEAHMLSLAAFNALLKLLEEPPAHAFFILATTEIHRLPATIISRTQRFDFRKIQVADIAQRLRSIAKTEQRGLAAGVAERIARLAGGSVRDAESLLGQIFALEGKTITMEAADLILPRSDVGGALDIFTSIMQSDAVAAIRRFHELCDQGVDVKALLRHMISLGRSAFLCSVDPTLVDETEAEHDAGTMQALAKLAGAHKTEDISRVLDELLAAERQLTRAQLWELPVELALVKAASGRTSAPNVTAPPVHRPAPDKPRVTSQASKLQVASATPKAAKKTSRLELKAVRQAWTNLQRAIGQEQPSLGLIIQSATVEGLDGQEVRLETPFKLHATRINDVRNRVALETRLSELLGAEVELSVLHTLRQPVAQAEPVQPVKRAPAAPQAASSEGGDLWEQVVASFGSA